MNREPRKIGIVGLGDMGKLYARTFAAQGHRVLGCDLPEKHAALAKELGPISKVEVAPPARVLTESELVVFSVEAHKIHDVVARLGPSIAPGTIVAGQTAVKSVEVPAFEKYVPPSCPIVSCHSLHGPSLPTRGQCLILIRHRATDAQFDLARDAFAALESRETVLADYREHDRIMADIQSVTHITFESMGSAWTRAGRYPWENPAYLGGIDNVKALIALRIFAGKAHVYGELAMLNPFAGEQINQYSRSVAELLALMEAGDAAKFRARVLEAREALFRSPSHSGHPPLLDDAAMGEFRLGLGAELRKPNSHLSLLSMADTWTRLSLDPYHHLACETPVFRLRFGIVEHLFRDEQLLEESIAAAIGDPGIRGDDRHFGQAVLRWSELVARRNFPDYETEFERVRAFFKPRLAEGLAKSTALISRLT